MLKISGNKKNRKGQLKIQEMAFVLLAVVFLFALIFLFFVQFQTKSLSEQARVIREERTIALLDYVAAMPELGCSGLEELVCVDIDKLNAFNVNKIMQDKYKKIWESAFVLRVSVRKMYPPEPENDESEYVVYESDEIMDAETPETYSTFIPICEAAAGGTQCGIGRILITVEMPTKAA